MQTLPATIHQVVAELEGIIDDCAHTNNRLGYFAALYYKVTCRVRDGIKAGEFEDGARMERLDVTFANRYIAAWRAFRQGGQPSASWAVAFNAFGMRRALVLQHLLLGMNAHINLDLGIAAAAIARTEGLPAMRKDFIAINGILAMLTGDVMSTLRRVSPLLSLMGLHASRYNNILIQFSLSNARDGAWCFAEEVFGAAGTKASDAAIAARDGSIAGLANGLTHATGPMRLTLWVIHLFEWRKPARIIALLRSSGPAVIHATDMASGK